MTSYTHKISAACAVAALSLLSLTGCGGGGIVGEINELGRDSADSSSSEVPSEITATLSRVVDGDTIAVKPNDYLEANSSGNREHSVRVLGVDAPEMDWDGGEHECGAAEATDRVESMLEEGDEITLNYDEEADQFDRYGRSLAYVETVEGEDVGEVLMSEGLAAAWYPASAPEPGKYPAYAEMMTQAQNTSAGSWARCAEMGR